MALYVKVNSADLLRDTDIVGDMDPYVKLKIGRQKKETTVIKNGGKHPHWDNQTLIFKNFNDPEMIIKVKDKDVLFDDTVGETKVNLQKYISNPVQHQQTLSLYYHGKPAGEIRLSIWYQMGILNQNNSGNRGFFDKLVHRGNQQQANLNSFNPFGH